MSRKKFNHAASEEQRRKAIGGHYNKHEQAIQNDFMFLARGNQSVNLTALVLLGLVASGALIDGVSATTTTPANRETRARSGTSRTTIHNETQVQASSVLISEPQPPIITQKTANVIIPSAKSTQAPKPISKKRSTSSNVFNTENINGVNGHEWALEQPAEGFKSDTTGRAVALIEDGKGNLNLIGSSPDSTTKHPNGQVNMAYAIDTTSGPAQEVLAGTTFTSSSSGAIGQQLSKGDFNGDEIPDVLIQAGGSKDDDPRPVFIVFGNANGLPENVDLDTMPQGTGVKIIETNGDESSLTRFGKNAASIGDPDGSGYDKIAIPNCFSDSVCIINGRPTSEWPNPYDLSDRFPNGVPNAGEGTIIDSLIHTGFVVYHPFSLPNVTGNGMDGFAISCPYDQITIGSKATSEGVVNIFYPNPDGFPEVISNTDKFLKDGGGLTLRGGEPYAYAGKAVTTGFTTVDGTPALAVGAPQAQSYGPGTVYVIKTPIQDTIKESPFNLKELTPEQGLVMPGRSDGDLTGSTLVPGYTFFGNTTNALVAGTGKGIVYIAKVGEPNSANEIPLTPDNPEVMTVIGVPGAFGDELGQSMDSAIDPKTNTTVIALGAPGAAHGGNIITLNGGQEFPSSPTPAPSPAGDHKDDGDNADKWIGTAVAVTFVAAAATLGIFAARKTGACRQDGENMLTEESRLINGQ
jgi:hypothetical protein